MYRLFRSDDFFFIIHPRIQYYSYRGGKTISLRQGYMKGGGIMQYANKGGGGGERDWLHIW